MREKRKKGRKKDYGYITVSLPKAIADDIDQLTEKLGYWPSRGAFVREACIKKIDKERQRKKEAKLDG